MSTFKGYAMAVAMAIPTFALASSESEPNNPIGSAEALAISTGAGQATGGATVEAVLGGLSGAPVGDLDFFTFSGKEGDLVTLDIDGGIGGLRNVDTMMGIFDSDAARTLLRFSDDELADAGSQQISASDRRSRDARIEAFRLPATGTYVVGVSSWPRAFKSGGGLTSSTLNSMSNGDYTLIVSGVSLPLLQISIDIKPGSGDVAPINPKAKGKVPVALLGASDFDVDDVDTASLRFGHSGNEESLFKCGNPSDVNGDLWPDMVCHFENQAAKFEASDNEAIVRGKLEDGSAFEGRGWLKVVAVKH